MAGRENKFFSHTNLRIRPENPGKPLKPIANSLEIKLDYNDRLGLNDYACGLCKLKDYPKRKVCNNLT